MKSIYTDHSKSLKDQLDIMSGIREFAEYNLGEFGKQEQPQVRKEEEKDDLFMVQKELKVER